MSRNPADFDPREIVGDLFDPQTPDDDDEEGVLEISLSEDGDGFTINGPLPAVLDLFTSGIRDAVLQGGEVGEFDGDAVDATLEAVDTIRRVLDLDDE